MRATLRWLSATGFLLGTLSPCLAQSAPPCMPGGVCCINGTCGTLEQFKRNAKVVCLQADAIENKSLPQSIELAGRCTAAQIMAHRVEGTQQENAREHQRALEAQRKLTGNGRSIAHDGTKPAATGTQDHCAGGRRMQSEAIEQSTAVARGVGAMR